MAILYTVPQAHAIVIERFGKYSRVQTHGINFKIPIVEQIKYVPEWNQSASKNGYLIELAEQRTDTPIRQCHTKDNVAANVNASIYWRISDPRKAVYEIDNLPSAIADLALNALRANIGLLALDQILSERKQLNERVFSQLKDTSSKWGIQLLRVEIQELTTSDETATAMRQEMAAERQRRAIILQADGQKTSDITTAEGKAKAIEIIAQAEANAITMIAGAEAGYLEKLKEKVSDKEATQILIANKYIRGMSEISKNPADKVFLPNSFNGIFSIPTDGGGKG